MRESKAHHSTELCVSKHSSVSPRSHTQSPLSCSSFFGGLSRSACRRTWRGETCDGQSISPMGKAFSLPCSGLGLSLAAHLSLSVCSRFCFRSLPFFLRTSGGCSSAQKCSSMASPASGTCLSHAWQPIPAESSETQFQLSCALLQGHRHVWR